MFEKSASSYEMESRRLTRPGPRPTVGTGSESGKTTLRRQDEWW